MTDNAQPHEHPPSEHEPPSLGQLPDTEAPAMSRRPRIQLLVLVVGLAASAIGYRIIEGQRLEQSAILFLGLPTLLATLLVLGTEAKTSLGIVLKGTTLALLMSMVVLGEGAVCVLMAAPIIYVTVGVVWGLATWIASSVGKKVQCMAALPLLVLSLEGSTAGLSFPRAEHVQAHRVLRLPDDDIERRLSRPPKFDTALPAFLQLGFPRPQWIESSGIELGDRWTIHFAGGEGEPGDLVLEVARRTPGEIRFDVLADRSKIAHWLTWHEAVVRWEAVGEGVTHVSLELAYDRELDPSWYFGPLERHAVGLAASYLLDNLVVSDR